MCGPHIPLILAGTTPLTPVGSDISKAMVYPALTFGKDVNVMVSPKPEHCPFVLGWVKAHGLDDSIAVFTTKTKCQNSESEEEEVEFVKCEDFLSENDACLQTVAI